MKLIEIGNEPQGEPSDGVALLTCMYQSHAARRARENTNSRKLPPLAHSLVGPANSKVSSTILSGVPPVPVSRNGLPLPSVELGSKNAVPEQLGTLDSERARGEGRRTNPLAVGLKLFRTNHNHYFFCRSEYRNRPAEQTTLLACQYFRPVRGGTI